MMNDLNIAAEFLRQVPGQRIVLEHPWQTLTAAFAQSPAGPVALFCGRRSATATGATAKTVAAIEAAGRRALLYPGIEAEPKVGRVLDMAAFLKEHSPGAVIALGGGSVMDAAKAALLQHQTGWDLAEHFGLNRYSEQHPEARLDTVICIPTTSGTGSEATPYSNIVDPARGVKMLIAEKAIVPRLSFLIPELTATMPHGVTLATGCDALAHAVEGLLNIGMDEAQPDANDWALTAIRLIRTGLPRALRDGSDPEARQALSMAAALAGMVIRFKPTGLPHLCSFSWYGVLEHGLAVAMLLPASWRYYLDNPAVAERTMLLAELFPGHSPEEVIRSFRVFLTQLGVPLRLGDVPGITPTLLARTAASGAQNSMKLEKAPQPVPLERAESILTGILQES